MEQPLLCGARACALLFQATKKPHAQERRDMVLVAVARLQAGVMKQPKRAAV
jgi:hypothetical protein